MRHIWSGAYLDQRFSYKPDHPLLCVALRVYRRAEPWRVPVRAAFFGCRSWIELPELPVGSSGTQASALARSVQVPRLV